MIVLLIVIVVTAILAILAILTITKPNPPLEQPQEVIIPTPVEEVKEIEPVAKKVAKKRTSKKINA
jgi:hypothetical protein